MTSTFPMRNGRANLPPAPAVDAPWWLWLLWVTQWVLYLPVAVLELLVGGLKHVADQPAPRIKALGVAIALVLLVVQAQVIPVDTLRALLEVLGKLSMGR